MKRLLSFGAMAAVAVSATIAQSVTVDPTLSAYTPTQGVSGTIKSIGSDTMNNLMTLWGEEFRKFYPNTKIEIEGKGSSTAPPALIEGQAQFGPMSRAMKSTEIDKFEAAFGYKPTPIRTSIDALAVFVHKDCPLNEISFEQLRKVFSVDGPEMTWGDLGVTDARFATKPVSLYGRNSASGTYGFFKEHALGNKDYKPSVKEQPGSSAVVQGVARDLFAMGYSGIGYKTADVKALQVSNGGRAFEATADNCYTGDYPLARFLFVYVNSAPNQTMDPLRAEFVRLIFSKAGQEVVVKDGYIPVPATIANEDLKKLGLK